MAWKPAILAACIAALAASASRVAAQVEPGSPTVTSDRYAQPAVYVASEPNAVPTTELTVHATPAEPVPLAPRAQPGPRMAPPGGRGAQQRRSAAGNSWVAVGGSLALVVGLFLVVAWFFRRSLPAGTQALPSEVVEVLGRTPLTGRLQAHLIRCGNKLLLVSLTATGAETLTEITDPGEVDRLAGLCRQAHPHSSTSAFRQVFQSFARLEPPAREDGDA